MRYGSSPDLGTYLFKSGSYICGSRIGFADFCADLRTYCVYLTDLDADLGAYLAELFWKCLGTDPSCGSWEWNLGTDLGTDLGADLSCGSLGTDLAI
jgi:hypothetical protein